MCRWCGEAFFQTTSAVCFSADPLRMRNCPRHRGRADPAAVVSAGKLSAAATAKKAFAMRRRARTAAKLDDPANLATCFQAIKTALQAGERLCMGRSSPCYVGKRLGKVGTLVRRQIPVAVDTLIKMGNLRIDTIGKYPSGAPLKGLVLNQDLVP